MPRHTAAILILAFAVGLPAGVEAGEEFTLREAVETALERNPSLSASAADAAAARARHTQARGHRLPKIDLAEVLTVTDNPAEVFALTLNQGRFDMDEFFTSDPNNPRTLDTWITRLEVTQPIYTGGKLSTRIEQAALMEASAEEGLSHARQQVAFDVATAYANALKAGEHLEVVDRARNTTAEHVALAEKYAEQGLIIGAEVLNARVHLAHMDEMAVEATAAVDLAQAALNFAMGTDQATVNDLLPLPPSAPIEEPLVVWTKLGVENRRDLDATRKSLEAGRLEEKAADSGFKPEVALMGRYELYDDQVFGSNGSSGSIMAVARINLFDGGSDGAAAEAARQRTLSGEHNIGLFEEGIRLQIHDAFKAVESARKRHLTAERSVAAAAEALRVREQRFEQGLDRMIDLLDAETALRESELREVVARYDLALSTYRLYFASGTSLTALFGSDLDPQESN